MKTSHIIGVGGIGTGQLFHLIGNKTLGRDESRAGQLSDTRDYCKGHIIMHYLAQLSGCRCTLIGYVGNDRSGKELLEDMSESGIDIRYVHTIKDAHTLLSVCFEYPDHSGGNITSSNSASSLVNKKYIFDSMQFESLNTNTIVFAAPEVPLNARISLMEIGKENNTLVAGSFLSEEMLDVIHFNVLKTVDILAVNRDEATALSGHAFQSDIDIAKACYERVNKINPSIKLVVTVGKSGAYLFDNSDMIHVPTIDVPVRSTAGAGDAFLAGILSGLTLNLPFFKAAILGNIVASFAVMSCDSISREVNVKNILHFINKYKYGKEIINVI